MTRPKAPFSKRFVFVRLVSFTIKQRAIKAIEQTKTMNDQTYKLKPKTGNPNEADPGQMCNEICLKATAAPLMADNNPIP